MDWPIPGDGVSTLPGPRVIERSGELTLAAGFFEPRLVSTFRARYPVSTRERLLVEQSAPGSYRIVNGFSDRLRWLRVQLEGEVLEIHDLEAGAAREAEPLKEPGATPPVVSQMLSTPLRSGTLFLANEYLALFESSGMVDWGTDDLGSDASARVLVHGRIAPPEVPDR